VKAPVGIPGRMAIEALTAPSTSGRAVNENLAGWCGPQPKARTRPGRLSLRDRSTPILSPRSGPWKGNARKAPDRTRPSANERRGGQAAGASGGRSPREHPGKEEHIGAFNIVPLGQRERGNSRMVRSVKRPAIGAQAKRPEGMRGTDWPRRDIPSPYTASAAPSGSYPCRDFLRPFWSR